MSLRIPLNPTGVVQNVKSSVSLALKRGRRISAALAQKYFKLLCFVRRKVDKLNLRHSEHSHGQHYNMRRHLVPVLQEMRK